jgi:hypothetical protein
MHTVNQSPSAGTDRTMSMFAIETPNQLRINIRRL